MATDVGPSDRSFDAFARVDAVLRAADAGDFEPARAWLEADAGRSAPALRAVVLGQMHLAGLAPAPLLPSNGDGAAMCLAAALIARVAWLRGGCDEAAVAVIERSLTAASVWPRARLTAETELVRAQIAGGARIEDAVFASLRQRASAEQLGALVTELAALRAWAELDRDLGAATTFARRASRMARSEHAPQAEYAANLVLARCRRTAGRVHLAARILSALARTAPPAWQPLLTWERQFAGDAEVSAVEVTGPAALVSKLLHAARAGDGDLFEAAATALLAAAKPVAPMLRDVETLLAALDPDRPSDDEELVAFREARSLAVPAAALGLARLEPPGLVPAFLLVSPHAPARRVLRAGLPLWQARQRAIARPERRQDRLDTAAVVLASAGPNGVAEDSFFTEVYGFRYSANVHAGALRVLVHRLRDELSPEIDVTRDRGQLRAEVRAPVALPDPRCNVELGDRLLQVLATARDGASVAAVAARLGVSPRAIQQALREMLADGLCRVRRDGRAVAYVIEDTTFSEPTRHR